MREGIPPLWERQGISRAVWLDVQWKRLSEEARTRTNKKGFELEILRAEKYKRHWVDDAEKEWQGLNDEEKARLIQQTHRERKVNEIVRSRMPHTGVWDSAPEWFADIPLPFMTQTRYGFDSDLFIELIEDARSEYQSIVDTHGTARLQAAIQDLDVLSKDLNDEFDRNEERSQEIAGKLNLSAETRSSILFFVNGILELGSVLRTNSLKDYHQEVSELEKISDRQHQIVLDGHRLHFRRAVAVNVLERDRRGLDTSWEVLYEHLRVEDEELRDAYREAGLDPSELGIPVDERSFVHYDEDAIRHAVLSVLENPDLVKRCWHQNGRYAGNPIYSQVVDQISQQFPDAPRKIRGPEEGQLLSKRRSVDVVRDIVHDSRKQVEKLRASHGVPSS